MTPINTTHRRWVGSRVLKTNRSSFKFKKTGMRRNLILSGILNAGGLARTVRCPLNDWAEIIYTYTLFNSAIHNFKRQTQLRNIVTN